jgi:hypothetical protein
MPTFRTMLCALLASGVLLTSGVAEARFGKRSSPSSKQGTKSGGKKVHGASPANGSTGGDCCANPGGSPRSPGAGPRRSTLIYGGMPFPIIASPVWATRYWREPEPPPPSSMVMARMLLSGQALPEGGALMLNLGLEGRRWGVAGNTTSLALLADDGSRRVDRIHLLGAHLTYALHASDRGRVRAEMGVASAHAPHITFVGPSMGLSFERCLFWLLDLEGRAQLVPLPHLQLDTQVGLAAHMGALSMRAGWRMLLLDDRGLVDGRVNRERFVGPYVGVGLHF